MYNKICIFIYFVYQFTIRSSNIYKIVLQKVSIFHMSIFLATPKISPTATLTTLIMNELYMSLSIAWSVSASQSLELCVEPWG